MSFKVWKVPTLRKIHHYCIIVIGYLYIIYLQRLLQLFLWCYCTCICTISVLRNWYGVKQESSNQYLSMFLCLRIYTMISKRTMCCYILLCVLFLHSVTYQIFCFKLELKSAFFKIMFRNNSSHNKPQIFSPTAFDTIFKTVISK